MPFFTTFAFTRCRLRPVGSLFFFTCVPICFPFRRARSCHFSRRLLSQNVPPLISCHFLFQSLSTFFYPMKRLAFPQAIPLALRLNGPHTSRPSLVFFPIGHFSSVHPFSALWCGNVFFSGKPPARPFLKLTHH